MSPSDAPESDEPYWATACFSSAICIALIEKFGFLERSKPDTIASNFWPTWKRSGRCSSRSRPRSVRLTKPIAPSSPTCTSRPASWTARTVTVTVSPLRTPPSRTCAGGSAGAAAFELLHAEADALLLDIDVEDLRLDRLTLAVKLKRFLARHAPGDVRHVDHAVDVALEPDEQPELGRILDLALDHRADRMSRSECGPRIFLRLLEAKRNAALLLVDLEHLHVDFLRSADDLARVNVLLGPAHLGDVDEALDARLELDEGAIFGDVGDPAAERAADRIFGGRTLPRIRLELLHAERNALSLAVDADDLHLHRVADVEDLGRVIDALVRNVGDVKQAVDAPQIDEGAVIGDVLDHTLDHLTLGQRLDEPAALLGAGFLEDGAARHDDIAAA